MPTYEISDPISGKTLELTGDSPPTEAELTQIFSNVVSSSKAKPIMGKPQSAVPESTVGRFFSGVGGGMTHLYEGGKQRALELGGLLGLVDEGTVSEYQKYIDMAQQIDKPLMETTPGMIGEIVGQAAPLAPIPGGVVGGLLRRMGTAALASGAIGAIQPTTTDESPILNAAIGGALGAGGSAAISAGAKVYNIAKGPTKNAIQQLSEKYGIRASLAEIQNNPILRKMETWLESVPFIGTKRFREKQSEEAKEAARVFVSKYMIDPDAPDVMKVNRAYASQLFEDLKASVKGIHKQEIIPANTKPVGTDLLNTYPDIFKRFQDTRREAIIMDVVQGTKDIVTPSKTTVSPILNASGKPFTTTTPQKITPKTLTFEEAWTLRDGLGEMIGQARRKLASGEIDQTTLGQVKRLFGAVNDDIEAWTTSIGRPDIKTAITEANNAYKKYVVKYDIIQRAVDKANGTVGGADMFSPKKLSTVLKAIAYKDRAMNIFTKSELDEMVGLSNIMQVVKRAGQFAENPPTGNRWGLPIMGGGVVASAATGTPAGIGVAAGITSLTALATFLTSTNVGKRIALSASKIEPTSPMMKLIIEQAYRQAAKVPAILYSGNKYQNLFDNTNQGKVSDREMGPRVRASLIPKSAIQRTAQEYLQRTR